MICNNLSKFEKKRRKKMALDLRKSESKMTKLENQIHELEDAMKQLESEKLSRKKEHELKMLQNGVGSLIRRTSGFGCLPAHS